VSDEHIDDLIYHCDKNQESTRMLVRIAMSKDQQVVHKDVIKELIERNGKESVMPILEHIATNSIYMSARMEAAKMLIELFFNQAMPVLKKAFSDMDTDIEDHLDDILLETTKSSVGKMTTEFLIEEYKRDPYSEAGNKIALELCNREAEEITDILVSTACSTKNNHLFIDKLCKLDKIDQKEMDQITSLTSEGYLDFVKVLFGREGDAITKAIANGILENLNRIDDLDENYQDAIAELIKRKGEISTQALIQIVKNEYDVDIREMIIKELINREGEATAQTLAEIAQSDPDPEIRKLANKQSEPAG
jgi:HEAT repeat protein